MTMPIAISSWSVHGLIGESWYAPDENGKLINQNPGQLAALSLLDLPAFIAKDGISVLEICHFHFPSADDAYLAQLKKALADAGVTLANILIDSGNLSNPDDDAWQADIAFHKFWQDVAVKVGAKGIRVDCGTEDASATTITRSANALREIADYGAAADLITCTENWRTISQEADNLLEIMRQVDRPLALCVDFGNAEKTGDKYATLEKLLPHGTSIHCKAEYHNNQIDEAELARTFSLVKAAEFTGHISLIYGDTDDEWANILRLKQAVEELL